LTEQEHGVDRTMNARGVSRVLLILFFLSGASSLIFETLWQRMMVLVFGASAPATTAILTAFFCGIAFGSKLGGKMLSRRKNALLFYAFIELWIGLWAIGVPPMLKAVGVLYVEVFSSGIPGPTLSLAYRFLMSILVVLPATLGMGATIPVMNRLLTERGGGIGKGVALAYGVNTAGAVLGCLLTGFLLIRELGVHTTLYAAASLNALVVLSAVALSRSSSAPSAAAPVSRAEKEGDDGGREGDVVRSPGVLVGIYAVTGFLALGFEVLWMRMLGIYNTNSFTTFTLALSTYLSGFATGSIAVYPFLSGRLRAIDIFKLANLGAAAASLALVRLIYAFPRISKYLLGEGGEAVTTVMLAGKEALFALIVVFLPALFMGLAYPSLCDVLIRRRAGTGERSGHYYFVGNLGSIAGILAVGLILVPKTGLVGTLAILCAVGFALVALTLQLERGLAPSRRTVLQCACALLIGAAALYGFKGHPFNADGPVVFREGYWEQDLPESDTRRSIIRRYQEGLTATILVREAQEAGFDTYRFLMVDEQVVASTMKPALVDSKMLAHLPLLLHPDPKRALTVGFGSGVTSWSMTRHGIEVEAVEIEPEVVRSAFLFEEYNLNVLQEPNFSLIINDARDYLGLTDKRFDVISTDVTNLQYRQNANLYTREYFSLLGSRLATGGVACAWVPMSGILERDFKIILRTFSDVFPHTTVWYFNNAVTSFVLFIGTPEPLKIDMGHLVERFSHPPIRQDLRTIGVSHPFKFVHFLHMDEEAVRNYTGTGALHTDDKPILEFSSPAAYSMGIRLFATNLDATLAYRPESYAQYVSGVSEGRLKLFERATRASRLWTETFALYFLHTTGQNGGDDEQFLRTALGTSRAALNVFSYQGENPGFMRYFLSQRDVAPGSAAYGEVSSGDGLREDFDGRQQIPLSAHLGAYPPAGSMTVEPERREEHLERFRLTSGIEKGVGRGETYALSLRNTGDSELVGYIAPLALKPSQHYSIEYWIRSVLTVYLQAWNNSAELKYFFFHIY
jgi:spermidine synthase